MRFFGNIWKLKLRCEVPEKSKLRSFYIFLYNLYQYEHGGAISYKCKLKDTPYLPRGNKQIIITENVEIGFGCVIYQQVTIQNEYGKIGSPRIGNNCCIYPGVKIIGKVIIGDNVIIEANTVVTFDVKDNMRVSVADANVRKY